MARVLVTGADGFTGLHLGPVLAAAGHEVHGLVHEWSADRPPPPGYAALHKGNLLDADGLLRIAASLRPQRVVHLAAISFVAHGDVEAIYRTNIVGSRHLLAALAAAPIAPEAILLASSANVYGSASGGVIDETRPPAPANDYAVSKLAMEHMARTWMDRLPITLVRPFNYTGAGQSNSFLVPKIVQHYRERAAVLELGNLDVERDFSDVRMVVDGYRRLLDAGLPGRLFNVCSGRAHSLRQILDMAAALSGHRPEIRVNPQLVRANEVRSLIGDRRALEAAIGPLQPIALQDTLAWMLDRPA